jgi:uncharacterized protein with ParB-like and HNH nuclease domain
VDKRYWLINHVLNADDIASLPNMENFKVDLKPPKTHATKHGDNDQFRGSIEIGIDKISNSKLVDLIEKITKGQKWGQTLISDLVYVVNFINHRSRFDPEI